MVEMVEMVIRVVIKILTSLGVNANLDKVTKFQGLAQDIG